MVHSVGFHFICRRRRNKAGHYSSRLLRCIVSCMLWINITSITVVLCWVRWINTFAFFCLNALLYFCEKKAQKTKNKSHFKPKTILMRKSSMKQLHCGGSTWKHLFQFLRVSKNQMFGKVWKLNLPIDHWSRHIYEWYYLALVSIEFIDSVTTLVRQWHSHGAIS